MNDPLGANIRPNDTELEENELPSDEPIYIESIMTEEPRLRYVIIQSTFMDPHDVILLNTLLPKRPRPLFQSGFMNPDNLMTLHLPDEEQQAYSNLTNYETNTTSRTVTRQPTIIKKFSPALLMVLLILGVRKYYDDQTPGNLIYDKPLHSNVSTEPLIERKLVCYYSNSASENNSNKSENIHLDKIDAFLCTHINIGIATIENNTIVITEDLKVAFQQMSVLKRMNEKLKVLIWIGGPSESASFYEMIHLSENRREFIKSIKLALKTYNLDGVDLDWEFPLTYDKSRSYFSRLLHEIRRGFKEDFETGDRNYLLSVAVAAPEGIAYFAYDIEALNEFCDYVNIMTYDYHFYSKSTPFTGLNAPLYKRKNENSLLSTLNINASVNFWQAHGLDKKKIIVGLPTYGHSFRLTNPFNNKIGSPASGIGKTGELGFVTYPDVCLFERLNIYVTKFFDNETCSPYMFAATEWISYENDDSIKCKTEYVINGDYGGVMIFSLNTDDYSSYCYYGCQKAEPPKNFPLTRLVNEMIIQRKKP